MNYDLAAAMVLQIAEELLQVVQILDGTKNPQLWKHLANVNSTLSDLNDIVNSEIYDEQN